MIVRKYEGGHGAWINRVTATSDRVFTASFDRTIVVYERKGEGTVIGRFEGHRDGVTCMCVTDDKKGLITTSKAMSPAKASIPIYIAV